MYHVQGYKIITILKINSFFYPDQGLIFLKELTVYSLFRRMLKTLNIYHNLQITNSHTGEDFICRRR